MPTLRAMLSARVQIAALVGFAAMIIVSVAYTFGPFHLQRTEIAERVTAACAPMTGVVTHVAPADITERELSGLGGAASAAGVDIAAILPDAPSSARGMLREVSQSLDTAAPFLQSNQIAAGATLLQAAQTRARKLGASCPAGITAGQGAGVDAILQGRLRKQRAEAKKSGAAPPAAGGGAITEEFVTP